MCTHTIDKSLLLPCVACNDESFGAKINSKRIDFMYLKKMKFYAVAMRATQIISSRGEISETHDACISLVFSHADNYNFCFKSLATPKSMFKFSL